MRLVAACLTAGILAAGCGNDDGASVDAGSSTTEAGEGRSIVLSPVDEASEDELSQAADIISRRLDDLGVTDGVVRTEGGDVVVELPGARGDDVVDVVGDTAELTFRPVLSVVPPGVAPDCDGTELGRELVPQHEGDANEPVQCFEVGPPAHAGSIVETASAELGGGDRWSVAVTLTPGPDGLEAFNATAASCFERSIGCPEGRLAIVLDDEVMSAPTIQEPSFDREGVSITGQFSEQDAEDLALVLRSGALPIQLEVVEDRAD